MLCSFEEEFEIMEESETEFVQEGANTDYRLAFKKAKAEFKTQNKLCKTALKAKDYAKAKECTKKMLAAVSEAEKVLNNTDESAGSAIIGYFAYGFATWVEYLLPTACYAGGIGISAGSAINALKAGQATTASIVGGAIGGAVSAGSYVVILVKSILDLIKMISQIINNIKSEEVGPKTFNLYRTKLQAGLKDFKKQIKQLEQVIDQKSKEDK